MGTDTLRTSPAEESREKLRELFTKESRALYEYALLRTDSPERAKQVLEQTLREAARTPSLCLSRPNFLMELCEHVASTSRPARVILERLERPLDLPEEPQIKAQPPVGAVRRVQARPQAPSGYDIEQDEWLKTLRESRKSGRAAARSAGTEQGAQDDRAQERTASQRRASELRESERRAREAMAARSGAQQAPDGELEEFDELFDEMDPPRASVFGRVMTWFFALVVVFLAWCVIGLMMNTRLLPWVDLGYGWFNTHIYDVF